MNSEGTTNSELINELRILRDELNSMKELSEKEISSLKIEAEKLRRSEEIYRLAFSTSPDSINITRLSDGMYVSINE